MNYNTDIFTGSLYELGITLDNDQINKFIEYYEIIIEKNKVMNLTAITEYNDFIIKHFVDSLSLIKAYDLNKKISQGNKVNILDMGTGAGFPGIPLKIAYPEINITLLDSLNKRINFLNEVTEKLDLNEKGSVTAIHSRAEDYIKQENIRESFDLVISRAVANLSTLSEYCIPYVKKEGYFIPYKSEKTEEEVKAAERAISILGGKTENICSFVLPGTDAVRTLISIKKTHHTKDIYPRKAGLPSKDPL